MTVKEIKELDGIKGQYSDIEVYRNYNSDKMGFHTDRIQSVESYSETEEVTEYQLMDEEDYNSSICASTGASFADFFEPEDYIKEYLEKNIALKNIVDLGDTKTPSFDGVQPAIQDFLKNAKSAGFVNAPADEDGYLRRVNLLFKYNGNYYPQLILLPILEKLGNPQIKVSDKYFIIGDMKIPRAEDGSFLIRFFDREFDEYDNQISISDAYLCKKCEKLLVSMVKEMDESGFYNYWTGDSTPKDLYENAEYIKGELQAGNTEDFSYADYLNYKEQFINSIKLFLLSWHIRKKKTPHNLFLLNFPC